ncbi:MAG TPA: hypothetical protein VE007_06155 [Thermoanaerobaculia bacterium]|nr:hypothetical protein [Thermoanaerobaculia bacterium]
MKITLDKIASSTARLALPREVEISPHIEAKEGNVLAVRALMEKSVYDRLELVSGRMAKINKGDVMAGTLGYRRALKGFVGVIPDSIHAGDTIHVLNLGGVLGLCVGKNPEVGSPLEVEVLGSVLLDGKPANIAQNSIPARESLGPCPPLVVVAGTCMSAGKTAAASEIVKRFAQAGHRVAAAKLSGVACLKDTLDMEDHGAFATLSFLDCGLPSTAHVKDLAPYARSILADLAAQKPDVIVVELGDGILGDYRVGTFFGDPELVGATKAVVMCANDLVAAWGAQKLMEQWGIPITIVSGPVTDNQTGTEYVSQEMKLPAANAKTDGRALFGVVYDEIHKHDHETQEAEIPQEIKR